MHDTTMAAAVISALAGAHVTVKVLVWTATVALAYLGLQTVYNLYLHPLRATPGPILARASRLWARVGNHNGCKSHRIHAAHQTYGQSCQRPRDACRLTAQVMLSELAQAKSPLQALLLCTKSTPAMHS